MKSERDEPDRVKSTNYKVSRVDERSRSLIESFEISIVSVISHLSMYVAVSRDYLQCLHCNGEAKRKR